MCGGGGGQSTLGPIYEKWGRGGTVHFRSIYEKWGGGGGGGQSTSGPIIDIIVTGIGNKPNQH